MVAVAVAMQAAVEAATEEPVLAEVMTLSQLAACTIDLTLMTTSTRVPAMRLMRAE